MLKIPWSWFLLMALVASAPTENPNEEFSTTLTLLDKKYEFTTIAIIPEVSTEKILTEILENEIDTEAESKKGLKNDEKLAKIEKVQVMGTTVKPEVVDLTEAANMSEKLIYETTLEPTYENSSKSLKETTTIEGVVSETTTPQTTTTLLSFTSLLEKSTAETFNELKTTTVAPETSSPVIEETTTAVLQEKLSTTTLQPEVLEVASKASIEPSGNSAPKSYLDTTNFRSHTTKAIEDSKNDSATTMTLAFVETTSSPEVVVSKESTETSLKSTLKTYLDTSNFRGHSAEETTSNSPSVEKIYDTTTESTTLVPEASLPAVEKSTTTSLAYSTTNAPTTLTTATENSANLLTTISEFAEIPTSNLLMETTTLKTPLEVLEIISKVTVGSTNAQPLGDTNFETTLKPVVMPKEVVSVSYETHAETKSHSNEPSYLNNVDTTLKAVEWLYNSNKQFVRIPATSEQTTTTTTTLAPAIFFTTTREEPFTLTTSTSTSTTAAPETTTTTTEAPTTTTVTTTTSPPTTTTEAPTIASTSTTTTTTLAPLPTTETFTTTSTTHAPFTTTTEALTTTTTSKPPKTIELSSFTTTTEPSWTTSTTKYNPPSTTTESILKSTIIVNSNASPGKQETTTPAIDELDAFLAAVMPEFTSEPHLILRAGTHEGRALNKPPRINRLVNEDGVEVLSGYSIVQLNN